MRLKRSDVSRNSQPRRSSDAAEQNGNDGAVDRPSPSLRWRWHRGLFTCSPIRVHALKLIAAQRVMPDVSNAAATVPSANAMKTPAESPV